MKGDNYLDTIIHLPKKNSVSSVFKTKYISNCIKYNFTIQIHTKLIMCYPGYEIRILLMLHSNEKIDKLAELFNFHVPEHENLAVTLLKQLSKRIDFKLKIQKASIQLVSQKPFAVPGFR